MNYDQYQEEFDDIITAFHNNELTEVQLEIAMEALQNEWEDEGEY